MNRARLRLVVVDGAPVAPPADEPTCPTCGLVFASPYFLAAHVCEARMRLEVRAGARVVSIALLLGALLVAAAALLRS